MATYSAMSTVSISGVNKVKATLLLHKAIGASNAGNFDVAMPLYEASLALNPFDPQTYANRCICQVAAGKNCNKALEDAQKSLELEVTAHGYRAKGWTLRELGLLDEALVALDEGLEIVGDDWKTRQLLLQEKGMTFNAMGNKVFESEHYIETVDLYGQAHRCSPINPIYLANRSQARRMLEQWELAMQDVVESLSIEPTAYAFLQKALVYLNQGRYEEALTAIDAGLALEEEDEYLTVLKFDVYKEQGDRAENILEFDKAIEFYNAALEIHPDSTCLASRAWCRRSDPVVALQDAEESLSIEPTAWGYHVKGTVLNEMKRYKEAIMAFDAALTAWSDSSYHYQQISDYKEYAAQMQDRIDRAMALFDQATLAMSSGENDRAIQLYSQAIEFDESSAKIWSSRGSAWFALHVWDRALEDAQRSVQLQPTVDGYCLMAKALRNIGRYSEAVEAFEGAATLDESRVPEPRILACVERDAAVLWSEKGHTFADRRNCEQADIFLTTALAFNPCDTMLYARRGQVKIIQELWNAALQDAEKCLILEPREPIGHLRKFEALYGAKDYGRCIKTISDGVKILHVLKDDGSDTKDTVAKDLPQDVREWRDPEIVARSILRTADALILAMPPRLFDTFTGRLCERVDIFTTFEQSDDYRHLLTLTASGQLVDQEIIRTRIQSYLQYVMLSHRWDRSHPEPIKQDLVTDVYSLVKPTGVAKLQTFCRTAKQLGYRWAWSDTCCIDKTSSTEIQKSITSMATWYRRSALTIVYLSDVSDPAPRSFERSEWFRRGWTLQELLNPPTIRFYKADWTPILESPFNHKDHEPMLDCLVRATGIDKGSLRQFVPSCNDIRERLRWASKRRTTEEEDSAYSLMGIFDLYIPVVYGELKQRALGRLLQEIVGSSSDLSVLQWSGVSGSFSSCLPGDISAFQTEPWQCPELPADITKLVEQLRQRVTIGSIGIYDFQKKLRKHHPAPFFIHGRLTLTCIIHRVDALVKQDSPTYSDLYKVSARGLKPFQVTIENVESPMTSVSHHHHDFFVIRPWSPYLQTGLTSNARNDPERLVLEACVQLGQPFYALVLSRTRQGYYRRVAGTAVEVEDVVQAFEGRFVIFRCNYQSRPSDIEIRNSLTVEHILLASKYSTDFKLTNPSVAHSSCYRMGGENHDDWRMRYISMSHILTAYFARTDDGHT